LGQDQPLGHRRRGGDQSVGRVLTLIGVEDRESFEERDRSGLVAVAFRSLAFIIRNEAVGIDNGGAVLAFADGPRLKAWRKVSQLWPAKPRSTTAPQRINTFTPE
jgi:hypothetical protein